MSMTPFAPSPIESHGESLAAPVQADRAGGTPTLEQFQHWLETVAHKALFDSEHPPADLHFAEHALHWEGCMTVVAYCRIATNLLMQFSESLQGA